MNENSFFYAGILRPIDAVINRVINKAFYSLSYVDDNHVKWNALIQGKNLVGNIRKYCDGFNGRIEGPIEKNG